MKKFLLMATIGLAIWGCSSSFLGRKLQSVETNQADDPYLWLEQVESPEAIEWVKEQNAVSLDHLESDPRFKKTQSDLLKILEDPTKIPMPKIRGEFVYNFWRDAKHTQGVYRRTRLKDYFRKSPRWEILLDLDKLSKAEGKTWVYKGIECLAPDYERCLLTLSNGGSDSAVTREFLISKKSFVSENAFVIPDSKHSFSWISENEIWVAGNWGPDSLTDSGYPRTVRKLSRGQRFQDAQMVFEGEKTDVAVGAMRPENEGVDFTIFYRSLDFYNVKYVYRSDKNEKLLELKIPTHLSAEGFFKNRVIFKNRNTWAPPTDPSGPRPAPIMAGSLFSIDMPALIEGTFKGAIRIIWAPSQKTSFSELAVTKDKLFYIISENVVSVLYKADISTDHWESIKMPAPANGSLYLTGTSPREDGVFVGYEGFLDPETLMFTSGSQKLKLVKSLRKYFDSSKLQVQQFEATSADGTKIPYFLIASKNISLDGNNPTYLYAYGGFEISQTPAYSAGIGTQWLSAGGVYVVANIRGGGEFGPRWHQAALKENRQRAFDDFHAVAEDLISRKITSPQKLGIGGGSNGGLLVGVAFTQRPDLYAAVSCAVPLLDMLRFHRLLAGASWMAEYGNPDIPAEREYLLKYSPYHNVKKDRKYPEVYFSTSTKDDRVHPAHARKMVARMKEQGHAVLYYENIEGGHSGAANLKQSAKQGALRYIYLKKKLGLR